MLDLIFNPFNHIKIDDWQIFISPAGMFFGLFAAYIFISQWYGESKKYSMPIDFWTFSLLIPIFIDTILMYPFAGSELNSMSVGDNIQHIRKYTDDAFFITMAGYFSMVFGRYLFDHAGFMKNQPEFRLYEKIILNCLKTNIIYLFLFFVVIPLYLIFIVPIILSGSIDVRGAFFSNIALRPIYNYIYSSISIVGLFLILKASDGISKITFISLFFLFIISLGMGVRSIFFSLALNFVFYYYVANRKKPNLLFLSLFFFVLIIFGTLYGSFRSQGSLDVELDTSEVLMRLFYGNNLSDLRDFAWVLSGIGDDLLYGKTYLAGILSFIPSSISEYRNTWAYGAVTAAAANFDRTTHPGLRMTIFGEAYINFGIFGVVLLGLFSGYVLRKVDLRIKYFISRRLGAKAVFAASIPYAFVPFFYNSSSAWSYYNLLGLIFFLFIARGVLPFKRRSRGSIDHLSSS